MRPLSMNKIAQIFDVDRSTVYSWLRKGCPHGQQRGPGLAGEMIFRDVLAWRLGQLAAYYTEEGLRLVETQARARLKEVNRCR